MSTLASITRQTPIRAHNVVVGGGIAAGAILHGLARSARPGHVLVITRGNQWPAVLPRHHLLGQSREGLTLYPHTEFHHPKGRMTAEEHMRQIMSFQQEAIEPFHPDQIRGLETDVKRIVRRSPHDLLLECVDGSVVATPRVFLATGVGPERTLENSGVVCANQPSPRRRVYNEVTTALKSMEADSTYWRGKNITIYGGGATAAWVAERAMEFPINDLAWFSKAGFAGANPGNRNSETLRLTDPLRYTASLDRLLFLGDLDAAPGGDGIQITTTTPQGQTKLHQTDIVICATGSDPMAPTGIQSMISADIYRDLAPVVGAKDGVFAATPERDVVIVSTALTHEPSIRDLIERKTFPLLNPENRVVAGLAVGLRSAQAAIDDAIRHQGS